MQFRGYGQQGAGERRRGGGRGRGAGGRIKEERRELTPTRQDTLSIIKIGAVSWSRTVSCTLDS